LLLLNPNIFSYYILNFTFNPPSKYIFYYTYIRIIFFFIILQENIDTFTVERVESVGEEDCIKIETEEEFCIQLVRTVKCEEEVSVVCWFVLW
jgi:hypothetical protein